MQGSRSLQREGSHYINFFYLSREALNWVTSFCQHKNNGVVQRRRDQERDLIDVLV